MQKREKLLFGLSAVCRSIKNFFLVFLQCAEAWKTSFWPFCSVQKREKLHLLDFSLFLTLPYPIRNSLPFTSFRSVTVGSGRDFLEGDTRRGQSQGLLGPVDPEPEVAAFGGHAGVATLEVQVVRADGGPWVRVST